MWCCRRCRQGWLIPRLTDTLGGQDSRITWIGIKLGGWLCQWWKCILSRLIIYAWFDRRVSVEKVRYVFNFSLRISIYFIDSWRTNCTHYRLSESHITHFNGLESASLFSNCWVNGGSSRSNLSWNNFLIGVERTSCRFSLWELSLFSMLAVPLFLLKGDCF
jgi:hypothetical protein